VAPDQRTQNAFFAIEQILPERCYIFGTGETTTHADDGNIRINNIRRIAVLCLSAWVLE